MKKTRFLLVGLVIACLAAVGSWATITDDINPVGNRVYVTVSNPDSVTSRGHVEVTAALSSGKTVMMPTGSFKLSPTQSAVVIADFPAGVISVINTHIVDDGDPITF